MKASYTLLLLFLINFSFCQIIKTAKFDTQDWTTENLNVESFSNGDKIKEAKSIKEWKDFYDSQIPAYCFVNFSKVNSGKLYNYFAIIDNRKLAPKGFHIPSFDEWDILVKNCGGEDLAGKILKSKSGWKDSNNNQGNNLNIKPATILDKEGFDEIKNIRGETLYHSVYFWTTTTMSDNPQESKIIGFENGTSEVIGYNYPYDHYLKGYYVRCVRDENSSLNNFYSQNNKQIVSSNTSNSQKKSLVSNKKLSSNPSKSKKVSLPEGYYSMSTKELRDWMDNTEEGKRYAEEALSGLFEQTVNKAVADINSKSNSSSSSNNKNSGIKPCPYCNKEFSKPSLKNNPRCQTEYTKTTNPGYTLCNNCQGYGYKITTGIKCDCIDGIGWCYDKECEVSSCDNGWIKCSHCNGSGQSR